MRSRSAASVKRVGDNRRYRGLRTDCLTDSNRAGCTENPRKTYAEQQPGQMGILAISPQTDTFQTGPPAALDGLGRRDGTAGCSGSYRVGHGCRCGRWPAYWIRSLVPDGEKLEPGKNGPRAWRCGDFGSSRRSAMFSLKRWRDPRSWVLAISGPCPGESDFGGMGEHRDQQADRGHSGWRRMARS